MNNKITEKKILDVIEQNPFISKKEFKQLIGTDLNSRSFLMFCKENKFKSTTINAVRGIFDKSTIESFIIKKSLTLEEKIRLKHKSKSNISYNYSISARKVFDAEKNEEVKQCRASLRDKLNINDFDQWFCKIQDDKSIHTIEAVLENFFHNDYTMYHFAITKKENDRIVNQVRENKKHTIYEMYYKAIENENIDTLQCFLERFKTTNSELKKNYGDQFVEKLRNKIKHVSNERIKKIYLEKYKSYTMEEIKQICIVNKIYYIMDFCDYFFQGRQWLYYGLLSSTEKKELSEMLKKIAEDNCHVKTVHAPKETYQNENIINQNNVRLIRIF